MVKIDTSILCRMINALISKHSAIAQWSKDPETIDNALCRIAIYEDMLDQIRQTNTPYNENH